MYIGAHQESEGGAIVKTLQLGPDGEFDEIQLDTEKSFVQGDLIAGDISTDKLTGDFPATRISGTLAAPYDVVSALPGKPGDGAKVALVTFTRTVVFADNFGGSRGSVGDPPTAEAVYSVLKNGTAIGTVTISTLGVVTFATTGGQVTYDAADRMLIVAPTPQDATLADVAITLAGMRPAT
jgi:hypothetical protein